MAAFTLRFRVRSKEPFGDGKRKVVMTGTKLAENANMTENQSHFSEGESPQNTIVLFMDTATEKASFTVGSDALVTFSGPAS